MNTDKLRELFALFLKEQGLDDMIVGDGCVTVNQDTLLKYERIDKYRILFLNEKELKSLLAFCNKHGIAVWFGADKLCIGFYYRGCMRLSAYGSVQPVISGPESLEDRNHDELRAASSAAPRIS